jgi:outer membrane lipoprotein LolB
MHLFTRIGLGLLASSSLILTGCQQYRKPQAMTNQLPTSNTTASAQETNFSLQGKIGVRTPNLAVRFLHGNNSRTILTLS